MRYTQLGGAVWSGRRYGSFVRPYDLTLDAGPQAVALTAPAIARVATVTLAAGAQGLAASAPEIQRLAVVGLPAQAGGLALTVPAATLRVLHPHAIVFATHRVSLVSALSRSPRAVVALSRVPRAAAPSRVSLVSPPPRATTVLARARTRGVLAGV